MSTLLQSYSSGVMGHLNKAPGRLPLSGPCPAACGAPTRILKGHTETTVRGLALKAQPYAEVGQLKCPPTQQHVHQQQATHSKYTHC